MLSDTGPSKRGTPVVVMSIVPLIRPERAAALGPKVCCSSARVFAASAAGVAPPGDDEPPQPASAASARSSAAARVRPRALMPRARRREGAGRAS